MTLQGKVALVTGGSAGIGLAVVRRLVARGARVAVVARGQAALDAVIAEVGAERARAYALDVGDLAAVAALPGRVVADLGRLDIVVNNAGLHHRGDLVTRTAAELGDMVVINLAAPVVLTRAALDHLPSDGAVINIASLAGMAPLPSAATYSATKAGLRFFSVALGQELEERGIHVGVVSPGPVDTGFFGDIEGVSPIVFSQPMSTADDIADGVERALAQRLPEVAIPRASGTLATAAYVAPGLARWLRPRLIARGERNKRAYMARKGKVDPSSP